ncbi:secretin N-terminal domain-containing protein [Stenotrophomonas acidaminiphila]|uniref:secretin N-terminal domain-containing protein n=1 Tax=Stenotrophomonas acidaminiphila TaxID=128780 RepID=UPI0028AB3E27|nr:secretin N-terminal domain-containing protein [Stenotrophomonas acidaminiphila]
MPSLPRPCVPPICANQPKSEPVKHSQNTYRPGSGRASRFAVFLAAVLVTLLAAGCATRPPQLPAPLRAPKAEASAGEVLNQERAAEQSRPRIEAGPKPAGPAREVQRADPGLSRIPPMQRTEPVSLVLDGVAMDSFINIVYGMELGLPVQIDQSLRRRPELLSLSLAAPMPPEQAFRVAEEVLRSYGVRIEELGGVLRFMPAEQRAAEQAQMLVTRSLPEVPAGQRSVFVAMPLQFRRPSSVIPQAKELIGGNTVAFTPLVETNAVLLSGPGTSVRAAMQAINALDQSVLRDKYSMRVNPLHMPADLLAKELSDVLTAQGMAIRLGPGEPGAVNFVPINSANALVVFANSQEALDAISEWVLRLDQPNENSGGGGMYVYAARHTTVETMLPVLQALAGGGTGSAAAPAPAATPANAGAAQPPAARPRAGGVAAVNGFGGQLAADTVRNLIVFQGDAQSWRALQGVLARLDQPARQVLIEVTVAEVTLTDELTHGVEWALRNVSAGGMSGPLTALAGMSAPTGGLRWAALSSSGQTRATLNLFAKDSRVTILSTPRIMVKSGETASIDVGTEVPIITSQATASDLGNNGSILQSIQYRKTGTLLDIEAVVHSGQRVDLKVSQEVSEATTTDTSDISSPSILSRKLQTSLSLADGQSTLLGGLISSTHSDAKTKVPLLGDIPLIGRAFQNRNKSGNRTELLLLITPYVLEDATQVDDISRAVRDRFGRNERQWPGKPDPGRKEEAPEGGATLPQSAPSSDPAAPGSDASPQAVPASEVPVKDAVGEGAGR